MKVKNRPKKSSEIEYIVLWGLSGFTAMKSLAIYDNTISATYDMKYLYLCAIALVFWFYASAKLKLFNIFKGIRMIPRSILSVYKWFTNDYADWKLKRGYYKR